MLYGHVFRNAMLIVIAAFPATLVGMLFTGSLLIEVIFSLDGLGLLGYEAALGRDYPVMFGTLYFFTLLGLIMGIVRDPQFGPTVMFGMGGVLAEAIGDVVFRLAPLTQLDADEMLDDLATQAILGPLRGEPPIDRAALTSVLLALSQLAVSRDDIRSVDINPLIVCDGRPIAVDALVERAT